MSIVIIAIPWIPVLFKFPFDQRTISRKAEVKTPDPEVSVPEEPWHLKPCTCTYQDCEKSYSKYYHLQIHELKCTGEKPCKCKVKGGTWEFSHSNELRRYNKKHSGEWAYLCALCNRNFAQSGHLRQHQRVHSLGLWTHQPMRKWVQPKDSPY